MKDDSLISLLRVFVENRVKHNKDVSEIVIPTSEYDKALKVIQRYDLQKRDDVESTIKEEKLGHNLKIVNYNERSFLVLGDTRKHKEKLSLLGGRFNMNFTNPETDEKVAGWIFSIKRLEDVKKQFNL